jgi:hypothetical protein
VRQLGHGPGTKLTFLTGPMPDDLEFISIDFIVSQTRLIIGKSAGSFLELIPG